MLSIRKELLAFTLVVATALAIQVGCGGTPVPKPTLTTAQARVVIFGGDAPLCSILSFAATITGITLTPQSTLVPGGSIPVSVLPSGQSITLDFASLMDFATMLTISNVPVGTYSQLTVTLSNPQLTFLDPSKSPPAITTIAPKLSSMAATLDLNPAVTVVGQATVGVQLDFNLLKSVQTDMNGQMTGTVTPVFNASSPSTGTTGSLAEFEDIRGLVQSVTTFSNNPAFIGNFTLLTSAGPTLTINVSSSTGFDGVSGLSGLTAGTFVEVDASLDTNGNVVARLVEAEGQVNASTGNVAFAGLITSVTRNSAGDATQFSLFVREDTPNVNNQVAIRSVLNVGVSSATKFVIPGKSADFATFTFDASTLGLGQQVVVQGLLTNGVSSSSSASATAASIYLGLQSTLGYLSLASNTPVVRGTDGKTGGFTLLPCSPVFQGQSIAVLTYFQTDFGDLLNLDGLTSSTPLLLVKGLLFSQQTPGIANGVNWLPPANVQVATRIYQIK
jgi:hypothetical protein